MSNSQDKKSNLPRHRDQQNRPGKKPMPPRYRRRPFFYLIIAIVIFTAMMLLQQWQKRNNISWTDFIKYSDSGQIESVEIGDTEITGKFKTDTTSRDEKAPKSFTVNYNSDWIGDEFRKELEQKGIEVNFPEQHTWLLNIISLLLPIVLLVAIF